MKRSHPPDATGESIPQAEKISRLHQDEGARASSDVVYIGSSVGAQSHHTYTVTDSSKSSENLDNEHLSEQSSILEPSDEGDSREHSDMVNRIDTDDDIEILEFPLADTQCGAEGMTCEIHHNNGIESCSNLTVKTEPVDISSISKDVKHNEMTTKMKAAYPFLKTSMTLDYRQFVDKTDLLKQIRAECRPWFAYFRPPGSGKSILIQNVCNFFGKSTNEDLNNQYRDFFSKLRIGQDTQFISEHCRKYLPICLHFERGLPDTADEFKEFFLSALKRGFHEIVPNVEGCTSVESLLLKVTPILEENQFVMTIDEFDAPYRTTYPSLVKRFLAAFLETLADFVTAKDMILICGVVPSFLQGYTYLEGHVNTVLEDTSEEFTMFSVEEATQILARNNIQVESFWLQNYYGGYLHAGNTMYIRPSAVRQLIRHKKWYYTRPESRSQTAASCLYTIGYEKWGQLFKDLLANLNVTCIIRNFEELTRFPQIQFFDRDDVIGYLMCSGILTKACHNSKNAVRITNHEMSIYCATILRLMSIHSNVIFTKYDPVIEAFRHREVSEVKDALQRYLNAQTAGSYAHDHFRDKIVGMFHGVQIEFCAEESKGSGKSDFLAKLKDFNIIGEIKIARDFSNMIRACMEGIFQVINKGYFKHLREKQPGIPVDIYGLAFLQMHVEVIKFTIPADPTSLRELYDRVNALFISYKSRPKIIPQKPDMDIPY